MRKATSTWDKFRKERDLHRMHHKRIGQEKNKLLGDIKKLRKHYQQYEPTIKELKRKYELAMKEKMLVRIERDRLQAKIEAVEAEAAKKEKEAQKAEKARKAAAAKAAEAERAAEEAAEAARAAEKREGRSARAAARAPRGSSARGPSRASASGSPGRPSDGPPPEPVAVENFNLNKTFKGHLMSVSNLALHPKKVRPRDGFRRRDVEGCGTCPRAISS